MTVCNYKQFIPVDLFEDGPDQSKLVCEQAIYECRDGDPSQPGTAKDWRVPANWSAKIIGRNSLDFVVRVTRVSN